MHEMLKVQGIDPSAIVQPPDVKPKQIAAMAGNAMTQTILEGIIKGVLDATGWQDEPAGSARVSEAHVQAHVAQEPTQKRPKLDLYEPLN